MSETILYGNVCREFDEYGKKSVEIGSIGNFSVAKTFDCGQCFRFEPLSKRHYSGVAYGKSISFEETEKHTLIIHGSNADDYECLWKRYLGLDVDYAAIDRDILSRSDNPALHEAVAYGSGIHILRQEPWETICSFIISQNNNIPRIKKIIAAMSEAYGDELEDGSHAFPTADALNKAGEKSIFELKTGFRAKYIADAANKVSGGALKLSALNGDTESLKTKLCEVKGIGPKVALCSLLFGFGRLDAFPIDVWIKRVTEKYFEPEFDFTKLGPYAGVAQQYLFYYERYIQSKQTK